MAKKNKTIDFVIFLVVTILLIVGLMFLASASSFSGEQKFGDPFHFIKRQSINLGIGIIAFLIGLKVNLKKFKKIYFFLFLVNFILMFFVFIPGIKISSGDSARWFSVAGFSVQPSEFLKLSFILYLAHWLSSKKKRNKIIKKEGDKIILGFFIFLICLIGTAFYLQSDLSTLILILAVSGVMYFSSKYPFWHTIVFLIVIVLMGVIFSVLSPYRKGRIQVYLNSGLDPQGLGFQTEEAKIAIGSGKLTGVGLGMSKQRFGRLPEPVSDSIFAIIAEETGFIGGVTIVLLFLLFAWRGFKITEEVSDEFYQLVSVGITAWIFLQASMNIAAISDVMPLTGIPLPFISYGGSALISELAAIGILLNISKEK